MSYKYQDIPTATVVPESNSSYSYSYGAATPAYADKKGGIRDASGIPRGEVQPPAFRDSFFSLLFWTQLAVVVVLSIMYATGRIELDFGDDDSKFRRQLGVAGGRFLKDASETSLLPLGVGCLSSIIIAPTLTIRLFSSLCRNATRLIQMSIYMAIAINVILAVLCLVSGAFFPAIIAGLGAFFTWLYSRYVWHRIPLAAANLKTAIASLQSQLGVAFLGLAAVPVYIAWWGLWFYFLFCSINTPFMKSQVVHTSETSHSSGYKATDDYTYSESEEYSPLWYFLFFLMLVSFYWTNQVISNTVQTTVAGSVGTFWFVPEEASGCCSPALTSSLFRSVTYSFGSICLGSLIVAIIQAMRAMVQQARESAWNNRDGGGALVLCLAECLLSMLEAAAEYFNKWAFIYVGLYGYSYTEAGHNVVTLFRERGWSSIITDNLTGRVLGMMSFAIGLGTGLIGAVLAVITAMASSVPMDGSVGAMAGGSFLLALIVGMALASIVFTVVNGAADTIVVLFAEAPAEFQQNHPALAAEMNQAWLRAYPDMFSPVAPSIVV